VLLQARPVMRRLFPLTCPCPCPPTYRTWQVLPLSSLTCPCPPTYRTWQVLLKARPVMRAIALSFTGRAEAYAIDDDYAREDWSGGPDVDLARLPTSRAPPTTTAKPTAAAAAASRALGGPLARPRVLPTAVTPNSVTPTTCVAPALFSTLLHAPPAVGNAAVVGNAAIVGNGATSTDAMSGFALLEAHLNRLCAAATTFGYASHPRDASAQDASLRALLVSRLMEAAATWPPDAASRVRLSLHRSGHVTVDRAPYTPPPPPLALPSSSSSSELAQHADELQVASMQSPMLLSGGALPATLPTAALFQPPASSAPIVRTSPPQSHPHAPSLTLNPDPHPLRAIPTLRHSPSILTLTLESPSPPPFTLTLNS
jgi:hypothetical protein